MPLKQLWLLGLEQEQPIDLSSTEDNREMTHIEKVRTVSKNMIRECDDGKVETSSIFLVQRP